MLETLQEKNVSVSDFLRPEASYPTYPPYHKGLYLEEYFFDFYQRNIERFDKLNRKYFPAFWTNIYVNAGTSLSQAVYITQGIINQVLHPDGKYFTVCQHDDAPMNILPVNTAIFSAGGNKQGPGINPIPLICGPIAKQEKKDKEFLASFVGSTTHHVRDKMIDALKDKSDVYLSTKGWENTMSVDCVQDFIDASLKSKFVLCPRGYGLSSFRLYESMQLDAVPVYISDNFWKPFDYELNWDEFCVSITEQQIPDIYSILASISDEKYQKMKDKIKEIYENYFTLEGTCTKILQRLEMEL